MTKNLDKYGEGITSSRRLSNELWIDYLVRNMREKGYEIPDLGQRNDLFTAPEAIVSGDGEISDIHLSTGIRTNKGKIDLVRMISFDGDIFASRKDELYKIRCAGPSDFFWIEEGDNDRYFQFYIDPENKVEITEHSSNLNPLKFPEASWRDFPLIEKYKNRNKGNPKSLVDDVIKYINLVGTPDKPVKIKKPRTSYSQGPGLGLSLSQRQIYEFPEDDEERKETKLNEYGEIID